MADQGELRATAKRVSRRHVTAYPDTPEGEAAWVARELLGRLHPADDAEPATAEDAVAALRTLDATVATVNGILRIDATVNAPTKGQLRHLAAALGREVGA